MLNIAEPEMIRNKLNDEIYQSKGILDFCKQRFYRPLSYRPWALYQVLTFLGLNENEKKKKKKKNMVKP